MSDSTSDRPVRGRGRPRIHPVDAWLDGKDKLLQPGIDWAPSARRESIRSTILREAKKRRILVRTGNYGTGLELHFLGHATDAAPATAEHVDLDGLDWDALMRPIEPDAGAVKPLRRDVDFTCAPYLLVQRAYREAYARGVVARCKVVNDGGLVAIAAMVSEEAWAARDAHIQTLRAERAKL